jgi:hypothetical protein
MAQSVELRALFSGFGTGAGGFLGIGPVRGGTIDGAFVAIAAG